MTNWSKVSFGLKAPSVVGGPASRRGAPARRWASRRPLGRRRRAPATPHDDVDRVAPSTSRCAALEEAAEAAGDPLRGLVGRGDHERVGGEVDRRERLEPDREGGVVDRSAAVARGRRTRHVRVPRTRTGGGCSWGGVEGSYGEGEPGGSGFGEPIKGRPGRGRRAPTQSSQMPPKRRARADVDGVWTESVDERRGRLRRP